MKTSIELSIVLFAIAVNCSCIHATPSIHARQHWHGNKMLPDGGAWESSRGTAFMVHSLPMKNQKRMLPSTFLHRRPMPSRPSSIHLLKNNKARVYESNTTTSKIADNDGGDDDLPSWIKALIRLESPSFAPKIGQSSESTDRKLSLNIWEDEMSPLVASLSGMINVEALMAVAATEKETDNGLILPELKLLAVNQSSSATGGSSESMNDFFALGESEILGENDSNLNEAMIVPQTKIFSFLDSALSWEKFLPLLQKNIQELTYAKSGDEQGNMNNVTEENLTAFLDGVVELIPDNQLLSDTRDDIDSIVPSDKSFSTIIATEKILRDATQRIEFLINGTSSAFSPSAIQDLVIRAGKALAIQEASGNLTAAAYSAGRATAQYTTELVQFANGVLVEGYVSSKSCSDDDTKTDKVERATSKPLFSDFPSANRIQVNERRQTIVKAAEFASLSGAIYENTIPDTHNLGHSIVAKGKTAGIGWMVTDSIQYEQDFRQTPSKKMGFRPFLVRTFVIRGYDASDEEVDREGLLNVICTAAPVPLRRNSNSLVKVHEGMLSIAEDLLQELEKFFELTSPSHKFVLTGHSIGGSLSILLLTLLANRRGASFVKNNFLRVFTFGSPPIFMIDEIWGLPNVSGSNSSKVELRNSSISCSILEAFDLPSDIVYQYVQPWDPIARLFSKYDPLYPLIDDLGEDGVTLYASGPNRALRPITKAILESWEGWPRYRDNARAKLGQNYRGVGVQFLLLPETIRYLTDRLVSVNTAVPQIETVVKISPTDLLPSLNSVFPLDTFTISYIPVAIRSFVHHFFPAYVIPFVEYSQRLETPQIDQNSNQKGKNKKMVAESEITGIDFDWAEAATQLVLGGQLKPK